MITWEYWMTRDTQLRLDRCNKDEGNVVVTQYKGKDIVTQLSTKTWDVGMQCKDLDKVRNDVEDLVGLRGTLNSKSGSEGLLLVHKSMMYRVCMLRNLRLKR